MKRILLLVLVVWWQTNGINAECVIRFENGTALSQGITTFSIAENALEGTVLATLDITDSSYTLTCGTTEQPCRYVNIRPKSDVLFDVYLEMAIGNDYDNGMISQDLITSRLDLICPGASTQSSYAYLLTFIQPVNTHPPQFSSAGIQVELDESVPLGLDFSQYFSGLYVTDGDRTSARVDFTVDTDNFEVLKNLEVIDCTTGKIKYFPRIAVKNQLTATKGEHTFQLTASDQDATPLTTSIPVKVAVKPSDMRDPVFEYPVYTAILEDSQFTGVLSLREADYIRAYDGDVDLNENILYNIKDSGGADVAIKTIDADKIQLNLLTPLDESLLERKLLAIYIEAAQEHNSERSTIVGVVVHLPQPALTTSTTTAETTTACPTVAPTTTVEPCDCPTTPVAPECPTTVAITTTESPEVTTQNCETCEPCNCPTSTESPTFTTTECAATTTTECSACPTSATPTECPVYPDTTTTTPPECPVCPTVTTTTHTECPNVCPTTTQMPLECPTTTATCPTRPSVTTQEPVECLTTPTTCPTCPSVTTQEPVECLTTPTTCPVCPTATNQGPVECSTTPATCPVCPTTTTQEPAECPTTAATCPACPTTAAPTDCPTTCEPCSCSTGTAVVTECSVTCPACPTTSVSVGSTIVITPELTTALSNTTTAGTTTSSTQYCTPCPTATSTSAATTTTASTATPINKVTFERNHYSAEVVERNSGLELLTARATATNNEAPIYSLELSGESKDKFQIDSSTGVVTVVGVLYAGDVLEFQAVATISTGEQDKAKVTVIVIRGQEICNQVRFDRPIYEVEILERSSNLNLVSLDLVNGQGNETFEVVEVHPAALKDNFYVVDTTIIMKEPLERLTSPELWLTVAVSDVSFISTVVHVVVQDVNEAPKFSYPANLVVGYPSRTYVDDTVDMRFFSFQAVDIDDETNGRLTYTLSQSTDLYVDSSSGILYASGSSACSDPCRMTVTATDQGGLSARQNFTVIRLEQSEISVLVIRADNLVAEEVTAELSRVLGYSVYPMHLNVLSGTRAADKTYSLSVYAVGKDGKVVKRSTFVQDLQSHTLFGEWILDTVVEPSTYEPDKLKADNLSLTVATGCLGAILGVLLLGGMALMGLKHTQKKKKHQQPANLE